LAIKEEPAGAFQEHSRGFWIKRQNMSKISEVNVQSESLTYGETLRRNSYRIFFPLGIVAGLMGVGVWAMWTMGYPVDNIKLLHITLQSQGFLTFFVVGFLMTAFPRFSGTDSATLSEIGVALGAALVFLIAAFLREWQISQFAYLVLLATVPMFAGRRIAKRTKDLPASFLLLGFGLIHAFLGAIFSLVTNMGEQNLYLFTVGRQMLQVGFLLCMVLGITAKLAPFLTGYTDEPGCQDSGGRFCLTRSSEIIAHGLAGALLLFSFFIEPFWPRLAFAVRATITTVHFLLFAKIGRPLRKQTATIVFFWTSCWMIPLGFWTVFFLPIYKVAALHIVFIGGYSLMIFSFGMLVVLSHSGRAALLNGKLWTLKTVGVLALLALGFRLSADFIPNHNMVLLHYASGFWVVSALAWLLYAFPKMRGAHHQH
jgi:uncharacterized protein involved in response to NO